MGSIKTTGDKKEYGGPLTPSEAAPAVIQDNKAWLPCQLHRQVMCPEKCTLSAKNAVQFPHRLAVFANQALRHEEHSKALQRLLRAAINGRISLEMLPNSGNSFSKWLRHEQTPMAVQFKAAWVALALAEGREWPEHYLWYIYAACPRSARRKGDGKTEMTSEELIVFLRAQPIQATQAA